MSEIPAECRRLAAELQQLRSRSGLSLAALGAESSYSKSSWDRYLNARALPPWPAVSALCRLADEPEPRVRALWELAESAWSRRATVARSRTAAAEPKPDPQPGAAPADPSAEAGPAPAVPPAPVPVHRRQWRTAAAIAGVVMACTALTVGAAHEWQTGRSKNPQISCNGTDCDGLGPTTAVCGDTPDTLFHYSPAVGAGLEIRYAPQCRTVWARVWNSQPGDDLTFAAPKQHTQSILVTPAKADQFVDTPMMPVPPRGTKLTACLYPASGKAPECYTATAP